MRFGKLAIALGIGLLLAGVAAAQQPRQPGGFGGGFGGGGLASLIGTSKQLQDELKMEKEQVEKLTAALAKVREDLKDDLAKIRDRNTPQEERTAITKKLSEANNKAVETVLKPEQTKRLHQIENQQAGVGMFNKDEVKTALKLNDDQKEKIDTISKDLQKDIRDLFTAGGRNAFDAETTKKRTGLQKEAMESVLKVLTADQKATVKDLTGEPFELPRQGFGGGGGPGGTGGFGGFGARTSSPGKILSSNAQETLKLTAEQKKQLEEFQKEVDAKLQKLLTEEQQKQLKELQQGGGAGGGGAGRRPGAGGRPGGTPPGGGNRPN